MNNRPTGSATRRKRGHETAALSQLLMLKASNGPANWDVSQRTRLKSYLNSDASPNVALAAIGKDVHPAILAYLLGRKSFAETFGKTPAKPKQEKKPKTEKKVKFSNGGNSNATGNTRNNPIVINAIKKLENKLAKQEEAMVRARESQTQQALENSRRELAQIRREIREQQRNLREVVMRRGSASGSYRPGGLRATPYYTRFMERVYQRGDGQFVTLSPNGRPRRPMAYPNFTYRDTGRGIVMHAPMYPRRPRRKTLFRL